MSRRWGCVLGWAALALVALTVAAAAKPQPPIPEAPPGSVLLAHGRVYDRHWIAYAARQDGQPCLIYKGGAAWLQIDCVPAEFWSPGQTIVIKNQGISGPPWINTGLIITTARVARVKMTLECGEIEHSLHHFTRRDRRKTGMPRGIRLLPFQIGKADYVASAAAFNARGHRIGTATYPVPPRNPGLPPC